MMNWKVFRKRSWTNVMVLSEIRLDGLRKTTKNFVRVAGLRADIWTRVLPNTKPGCHSTTTLGTRPYPA